MWKDNNNCKSYKAQCVTLYLQSRDNYKHVYNLLHPLSKSLRCSSGDQQLANWLGGADTRPLLVVDLLVLSVGTIILLRCLLWPWVTIFRSQNLCQLLSIPSYLSHWSWCNIIMIFEIMIVQQLLHYLSSLTSRLVVLEAMDLEYLAICSMT